VAHRAAWLPERGVVITMGPHVVTLSSLFPSAVQPGAGLFVRERAFRLGARLPLAVVAPTPWFPLQGLLRRFKPGFRPGAPAFEAQRGFDVWYPRFFSVPGAFKRFDGLFMALAALPRLRQLKAQGRLDIIDAHFGFPDGHAASLLSRWLGVPYTVTLRGTETRHAADPTLRAPLARALQGARRVFAVADALRQVALGLGVVPERAQVVGNGVDLSRFTPLPQAEQRRELGLPAGAPMIVTVGGLCERKGFHRVMAAMPALLKQHPGLTYLVIGGPSPEGDWTDKLEALATELGISANVRFTGPQPPDRLRHWLSAADVFVLATRNEGWANVFLEAMACGLPVVTTRVGGNAEVVNAPHLGEVVAFDDAAALQAAIDRALHTPWDRTRIRAYAEANTWDRRIDQLEHAFRQLAGAAPLEPAVVQP
jgi:teichuronic acid biosynthesis glycosyltransferase TuaC